MEKEFYIPYDETIIIDKNKYPKRLVEIMDEMEELYYKKDWFNYDIKFDYFEITLKGYLRSNKITKKDFDNLLYKYGGLYD